MKKLLVPVVLLLLGVVTLISISISEGGVPELQVKDLASGRYDGRDVKVHGLLHEIQSGVRPLRFRLADKTDPTALIDVWADETRPDTFQVSYDVAVEGHWDKAERRFVAERVFTKCPSKYEAVEKEGIGSEAAYREKKGGAAPDTGPSR